MAKNSLRVDDMETIIGGIAKFGWVIVGGLVTRWEWERRKDKGRLEDTYTKKETEDQIVLRIKPMEITLEHLSRDTQHQTEAIKDLTSLLKTVAVDIAVLQNNIPKRKND
jgi:hypothetical protein